MRLERLRVLAIGILALVTVACGSSDGGSGSSQTPPSPPATTPLVGVFLDSLVQGLGYSTTPSGLSGTTDANGQFNYNSGDSVTFDLYGRTIGTTVPAAPIVTVLSVFNATSLTDPRVVNLSQLLLTLGGNPSGSNPIIVPATPPANFPASLDFSAAGFDTLLPGLTLVSEADAAAHLQENFATLSVTLADGNTGNTVVTSSRHQLRRCLYRSLRQGKFHHIDRYWRGIYRLERWKLYRHWSLRGHVECQHDSDSATYDARAKDDHPP